MTSEPARVVFWDFDGTLAHRPGMWRGGDNPIADVEGAHDAGIAALLVRQEAERDLMWAAERILEGDVSAAPR